MTSACRGLARNASAPNLERSFRDDTVFIISIAQQARPNVAGQRLDLRAQFTTASSFTVNTSGSDSNNVFSKPILCRQFYFAVPPRHFLGFGPRLGSSLQAPVKRAFL